MIRLRDWRLRLHKWALMQHGKAFEWGQTDCATLARSALAVMFGTDVLTLPTWETPREALAVLREYGPVGKILTELGAASVSTTFLRSGDIIVAPEQDEDVGQVAIFVCVDVNHFIVSTKDGVVLVHRAALQLDRAEVYSLWETKARG